MPRTKPKREERATIPAPAIANGPSGEVLTLSEAAAYLRLAEAEVLRCVDEQALPARRLGNEWRFLKAAIQDWLRAGLSPKPSKEAQLAVIGSWTNDPYLEAALKEIKQRRGQPSIRDASCAERIGRTDRGAAALPYAMKHRFPSIFAFAA